MLAELLAIGLLKANLAAGLATLVVLGLRGGTARREGRNAVCRLWRAVPIAALACLFPGPEVLRRLSFPPFPASGAAERLAPVLIGVWLSGVLISFGLLAAREAAFRGRVAQGTAGPAVVGVLWPRLVTPADFALRFTPVQRALIIAHERTHIARGDTRAGLIVAVCQALAWCNPFAVVAARLARLDLELACDAEVLSSRPGARRAYGEALLAAQSSMEGASACAWRGVLPVEARLLALSHDQKSRAATGALQASVGIPVFIAILLWAATPTCLAPPPTTWRISTPVILVDLMPR